MKQQQHSSWRRLRQKNGKRKEIIIDEITEEGHLARSLADSATYAATDRVKTARGLKAVEDPDRKSTIWLPEREKQKKGLTNQPKPLGK